MKEASLWVAHELCGYWLEDTLVLYVPDHQSKQSDRLGHNASSVHFIFTLFTYLCGQLRRMITVTAKAHSDIFSLRFFPSRHKRHPFILQTGSWCYDRAMRFQSAQDVNDYTSHQHVVGF